MRGTTRLDGWSKFSDDGMNATLGYNNSCPAEPHRSLGRSIDENVIRDNIPEASVFVQDRNDAELETHRLS
jgi:hypothetical protein